MDVGTLARMRRSSRRALRAGVAVLAMGLVAAVTPAAPATPIKIGLASVFDFAQGWMHDGAQFAVDEINASGGVLGRPLQLFEENDPALGNRAVQKLLFDDQVDALIEIGRAHV